MKRKMEKSIVYGARCIFSLLLAFFMVLGFMPKVVLAEKADKMAKDPIVDHPLNEKNNWDIRYELIMPGERFYTVPEYSASKEKLTYGSEVVGLWIQYSHASLMLSHPENQAGGEVVLDTDKLVRSTPNISQLIPQETTYNAIETAYNRGDLAFITGNPSIYDTCKEALKSAIKDKKQAIIGYRNDTNLPMVLEAVRGGTDTTEGMVKGGRYGEDVLVQERVMHNWGCQLCFYEPYYTLSYDIKGIDEKLTEEEKKELPDRYYIQRTRQELVLKNPIRAGRHFVEWSSMGFHEDVRVADGKTTLAFDWEHNLGHHKTYIGDQTLHAYFKDGFTVTFNPNGGRRKSRLFVRLIQLIMKTICFSILGNVFRYVKVINLKAGVLLHLPMRIVSFRILKILNGLRIGSKKEYMIQISINMIFSFMQNGRKKIPVRKDTNCRKL